MKVLAFDNWTGGRRHFERLVEAFSRAGFDLQLVHLGSWGNDPGRPLEEQSGGLLMRDIRYYGGASFDDILDRESPDVVLFLSTRTFAHRAFQRYCRQRGIPTIHLYHGLVRVQDVDGGRPYRPNWISWTGFVLSRVLKSLRYTWPVYARSLWRTSASIREWLRFGVDILDGARSRFDKVAADDARTTKCCVYTAADIPHAVSTYSLDPGDVLAVGNPDLIAFGLDQDRIGGAMRRSDVESRDVMYVDTALIATGLLFQSDADFVSHMLALRDSLARQGKRLLFKPHPDMRLRGIDRTLAAQDVEIISNDDFTRRLETCCAAIVETSTLALIPALMGMPLLLARFGRLASLQFGEVLRTYPRARVLENPDTLTAVLAEERAALDAGAVQRWIDENAGPLPAADMPRRVADLAAGLVRNRTALLPETLRSESRRPTFEGASPSAAKS